MMFQPVSGNKPRRFYVMLSVFVCVACVFVCAACMFAEVA